MGDEARQGFVVAPLAFRRVGLTLAVVGLRGLDDAPADSGSAGRHTDVRGLGPQVGYPQEGAPD